MHTFLYIFNNQSVFYFYFLFTFAYTLFRLTILKKMRYNVYGIFLGG